LCSARHWPRPLCANWRSLRKLDYRIDFGPGYRVYFGRDGEAIVVLLAGGTKKKQQRDIEAAHAYWQDYRRSKRGD
jgi:putative addiction module killer protein